MPNDNQIQMDFLIDDKAVKTQFAKVEKQGESTGKKLNENFSKNSILELASGFAVGQVAVKAFDKALSAVVNTVGQAIQLSVEAEAANIKLAAAFGTLNPAARQTEESFREFASALQSKIAVDDDFIKSNSAVLVSLGRLSGEGLERATKAAFDLSRGIGTSAESAFTLLAKAATGSTAALSRYGLRVSESLSVSGKFEQVLKKIEERFGGLSVAATNTFGGAIKVLNLSFEDLLQSFGDLITKSPSLVAIIKSISNSIIEFTKSVSAFGEGGDVLQPLIVGILNVGIAVNEYLIKPLELGFNFLRTGVLAVYASVQGLIALFVKSGDLFARYFLQPIVDGFGFIATKFVALFNQDLANRIGANIAAFGQTIGGSLTTLSESTTEVFTDSFDALANSAENTFKSRVGSSLEGFLTKLKNTALNAKAITMDLASSTAVETDKVAGAWEKAKERINKAVQDGIVASIASGLSKIGENLAKGVGAFDNFLGAVLSILGDLAIQVGTILIGIGLGIENLKVALATFNGAALVAAGAALIVLGGALKGLSGGSSSPATAPGAIAPSSPLDSSPVQSGDLQPRGASVQVNISGDVFDTQETGLRIVDILNQSFDQQGVTVRGMA